MLSTNNRRIVNNSFFLYFRMILIMGVNLYIVRIILNALGEVDYGLYHVIGGVVTTFGFLSNTLATASQRFFAIELGRNNLVGLKRVFSTTFLVYVIIAGIVLILAQTLGLWFVKTGLSIPLGRTEAAIWVYQFSFVSFIVGILGIPFFAAIIARENMKLFAWISLLEAFFKIIIAVVVSKASIDRLIVYSALIMISAILINLSYVFFSYRKYPECKVMFLWDKELFLSLVAFSGWSMFGAMSGVAKNQGVNILLNIFFNPIVNAARAIAYQISIALTQLAGNFITAVKPQIVKFYAKKEQELMTRLVLRGTKFSYFLLLMLSLPLLLETSFVLDLWLDSVPNLTVRFTKLILILVLIDTLSYPLMAVAQATGKIRHYQLVVGLTQLLNLPISYCCLFFGAPAEATIYVAIVIAIICLFQRLWIVANMTGFEKFRFIKEVLWPVLMVTLVSYIFGRTVGLIYYEGLARFFITILTSLTSVILMSLFLGFNKEERHKLWNFLKGFINKGNVK